ncbi:chromosome segregation protein ParM [Aeromonas aquatica]|uniref:chromosome segregation protein ParM n=1 Tax=Aeromonas aquatica TaxID=558964 RepID=UPI001EE6C304|nr:chromosome segregation protein ParM [Aeromonas aquatica]
MMRISKTQADVLFLLYAFEQKGVQGPIPRADMLKMINKQRDSDVARSNFRVGCEIMAANGLITHYRDRSQKLACKLTDFGRERAGVIYGERTKEGHQGQGPA